MYRLRSPKYQTSQDEWERTTQVKPLFLVVLVASLTCGSALSAQPGTPSTSGSAGRFNLDGTWKSQLPSDVAILRFEMHGDTLLAYLPGSGAGSANVVGFQGNYTDNRTVSGKTLLSLQPEKWQQMTLIIDDPDHVHLAGQLEIFRISPPTAHDAVCDVANSSHTQGMYAAMRAADAHTHEDYSLAACWSRIGAIESDPIAEGYYAWILESGKAGTTDYPQALVWAKKSADQHVEAAALLLEHMYTAGEGVPVDLKTANNWHQQAWFFHGESRWKAGIADPEIRKAANKVLTSAMDLAKTGADNANNTDPHKYKDVRDAHNPEDCAASGGSWSDPYNHDDPHEHRDGSCWPR